MVLLRLITDGPTDKSPGPFFGPADSGLRTASVNYGWSYFHMDSPTDKNPPDSGLLRLITDGPTDKSPGPFFDGPPDKSCGLRTPDPGPFFGTPDEA